MSSRLRHFSEERRIALSERSLKIVRRTKNTPKLLAVEVEADEQSAEVLELRSCR